MNIVLATGGTGGHIFPALKVAYFLKEKGHSILIVGALSKAEGILKQNGFAYVVLSVRGFSRNAPLTFLESIFLMIKAVGDSLKTLREFKANVVCGFGGYGSFPVVTAAMMSRCPVMIHEQNVVPGKANKLLAKFVKKIAITFEASASCFRSGQSVLTGCPCHAKSNSLSRTQILKNFGLDENKLTILIFGGSQGSRRINQEFIKAADLLKGHLDFQVIHASGKNDYMYLKEQYETNRISVRLVEFLEDMGSAYQASDVVVCRAGALSIMEIAQFKIPAVLIPYPYAGGHQKDNAMVLTRAGLAQMIEEKDLSAKILKEKIVEQITQRLSQEEMERRSRKIFKIDADQRIAQEILACSGKT